MKKVRCPKCDNYIAFDETRYEPGQKLVFVCPDCNKQFAIRLKSPLASSDQQEEEICGSIVVIENVFHFKQELPLRMGDNVIGRYHKTSGINTPIETNDPSIDFTHCIINVSRDKQGRLKYILRDGPSNTGTFIDNVILGDRERRVISDGTIFTIGATSVILKGKVEK
ncbi:MAG: FHA domain-containing protein [Prevotellaceae bacterium]|nr:FHA domain-containing protein [Prevotellaceae bacterium]